LFLHFSCWRRVGIVLASLPFAATGAAWMIYLLDFRWSFATAVGFLALAGVAAEFCVVMLLYLDQALADRASTQGGDTTLGIRQAVTRGALLRLRPKTMTVAVILGGLVPLMLAEGAGIDVMRRIAAPMVGGMITAPLFSLLVVPSLYLWLVGGSAPSRREPSAASHAACD
jgi:Cu(I)/Ag(I) efflux system membrane protein CusA/SilA